MSPKQKAAEPMTFADCVAICSRQTGLVEQWERLTGNSLCALLTADKAEQDRICAAFTAFVFDCVWMRGDWRSPSPDLSHG